jgi:hypothetical protein
MPFTDGYCSRQKGIPPRACGKVLAENTSRACEVWRFSAKSEGLDLAAGLKRGINFAAG